MTMAEKELAILITARDLASKTIGKVSKQVGGLGKMSRTAGKGLQSLAGNLAKLGTVAAAGAISLGVVALKAAGDFEAQMNTINTVAGLTVDQLGAVGKGIRQLARDSGADLADLTAAYYDLVSAGISAADAQGVLTAANTLAIGGLGTTKETIDLLTTAINSYGLKASDAGQIADQFAQAIAAGKVTAADLAASFAQVGSIAASSGIGINELAAGYAQLTAKGVPATEAATQMRAGILALLKPSDELNGLQKKTGINFAKLAKDKGMVVAFERMRVEAKKAGVPLVDLAGRVEAYNMILATTGTNLEGYKKNLDAVNKSEGVAERQARERQKGLNFQLARIKALARDAAITIGSKLLPKITPIIEKLAQFIDDHQADIERFGDALARGFEGAATWAARLPWDSITTGLQAGAGFAKTMVEMFANMPPEAMGAILALGGLNKLTGGAVGSIIGQLGSGLIKGVLGLNAGVVNAKAGVVNVIGGAGVPGGGLPGAIPKVAGLGVIGAGLTIGAGAAIGGVAIDQYLQAAGGADAIAAQTGEFVKTATLAQLEAARQSVGEAAQKLIDQPWNPIAPAAFGGLQKSLDAINAEIAARAARVPLGPPVPPGLTNAKLQGPGSMMLNMPGVAGIFSRAVAKGLDPSARNLQRTLERNTTRTAIAERARSLQQMFANLQLRAIAAKDFSPHVGFKLTVPVYLTSNVSVRNTVVRTALVARYTPVRT
jgi:TP901 family phage tail tape measure protein